MAKDHRRISGSHRRRPPRKKENNICYRLYENGSDCIVLGIKNPIKND